MRRSALLGLFLLCSACTPNGVPEPAPQPEARPRRVGVLVPASRGRCTSVVVGVVVRRVCLPGRRPQAAAGGHRRGRHGADGSVRLPGRARRGPVAAG
ncbi:MAG TPA: hypothetical protein VFQ76_11375 [Longimicrobiaceae bacterium]|nr:hypothetical protein [Longimicrobiaceae bacterium]